MADLTDAQLRILGESIGRGIVRELTRDTNSSAVQFLRTLVGVGPSGAAATTDRWARLIGEGIGKVARG